MSIDFEALGKYTHASDRANKLAADFNRSMKALTEALRSADAFQFQSAHIVSKFDAPALRQKFDEIAALHAELTEACHEANLYAQQCGKPTYYWQGHTENGKQSPV